MTAEALTVTPSSESRALPASRLLRDERLANLVCEGDRQAFSILYERYERPLYRYCLAILRDPDDARDALQVTMLNAFGSLSERADGIRVRPWLYRVAHNAAISVARERRRHDELPAHLSSNRLPIDTLLERELAEQILANLAELPARRRGALVMRELQGLPYDEIATALDVTPGAARQAVFEARETLANVHANGGIDCHDVCKRISQRDGRRLRSRAVRLHLRACDNCRRFGQLIHSRRRALATLPPLMAGARWRILEGVFQTAGPDTVTAIAAGAGGSAIGIPLLLKGLATGVAVLAVGAGTVAVDRIDRDASPPASAGAPATAAVPAAGLAGAPTPADAAATHPSDVAARIELPARPSFTTASSQGAAIDDVATRQELTSASSKPSPGGTSTVPDATGSALPAPAPIVAESSQPVEAPAEDDGQQVEGVLPGHGGTPPGQGGTPPGQANKPGEAGSSSGGTSTGQGDTPGQGGTPPGQGGTPPGQTESSGQGGSSAGVPPGQGGTPPGQGGTPPGQPSSSSGQSSGGGPSATPPGHGGTPPGQGGTPPGQG